ncbi:hypothetical protein FIBSPDRAFT_913674 [Athelia psychrophila]|uniref:BTB domain-containing protein n=1 Tax=Athelia psychrophila TaxID=1759441 RepID=A0A165ZZA7_9AGAM|nr:hypothetical protein FIBSPDRAFT_913674 [Fibularhizoctonia sp. CBS 109695]
MQSTENSRSESSAPVALVRSDIWYDDGNVILQAEGVQFKVHKSILAQSSSVFQDMFSFPQPSTTDTEMAEGCPIVHLSDSAEEVRYVLQAIFQRKYTVGEVLSLPVVSALLCLGGKYDIQPLHNEARKRLFLLFTITLHERDAITWASAGIEDPEDRGFFFHALLTARRAGLLSILPLLLYPCCGFFKASEIKNGFRSGMDGSTLYFPRDDQIACLAGYQAIYAAQAETTYAWLYQDSTLGPNCITPQTCDEARRVHLITYSTAPTPDIAGLRTWSAETELLDDELCKNKLHEAGREKFWEQLPGLFDLPSWEELSKERDDLYVF